MKNLQKKLLLTAFFLIVFIVLINQNVFANDTSDFFQKVEFSDDFKKWLELSDEEKKNVLMPRIYDVKYTNTISKNPFNLARMVRTSLDSKFSLKDLIPNNLAIRNQQQTNSCWTFAALSSLETNLALFNYKQGINLSKVYDYSERHLEYATSRIFANDIENEKGYNRSVGSGGAYQFAFSYLTNGSGAIPESEMPFENNENTIDISEIQNKTVSSEVYDTAIFPDYNAVTGEERTEIMNQIKEHIQNYGAVYASIHGNSSSIYDFSCYNNDTGAKYCKDSINHPTNHGISIVGWDDNYSVDNFSEDAKPTSNGAWIARNSWGERIESDLSELKQTIFDEFTSECILNGWNSAEDIPNSFIEETGYTIEGDIAYIEYGDNGYIYISYEDVNVSKQMAGIEKASDSIDYDYIYQYDEYFPSIDIMISPSSIMLGTIFNKQSTGTEYLTQVSLYSPETYTCKVYVNPNGTGMSKADLQPVNLKAGESETFDAGYHTLEFSKPIELTSDSFVVVVAIQSSSDKITLSLESNISEANSYWDYVTVEDGKCFFSPGNDIGNSEWTDLGQLVELGMSPYDGDSTIKAFTTTELNDGSLKNIEITTPPTKTSYFEGEDFDKSGMVVTAYYNSKTTPSVVLDSSSYNITNGTNLKAGQTSVTITYENKSVSQPITVEDNSVTSLNIKTPPTKVVYKEGNNFDKTGMVVEAIYKDGSTKIISDYIIEDGNNLKANQSQVTISYEGKTVTQDILVTPNPLTKIEITKLPIKTEYVVGQDFDKTGMVVTGTYQDGLTQEILNYTIQDGTDLAVGQTYVTIEYDGKTTTQQITVVEKTITEISISKMPTKTQYIQNKEDLDLTGGLLKITYNDNSSEEINLTFEQVEVSGFDNKNLGKNTITVTYLSQTTTFDIEIIEDEIKDDDNTNDDDENPKNSNFDNVNCDINSAKYYTFSDNSSEEYIIVDLTITGLIRNTGNNSYEYYYYLSPNQDETNIQNWIKITESQTSNDKIQFIINSKDIQNYSELLNSNSLYLYIREVVTKGGNQSVEISKAIPVEMDSDINMEVYVDNAKIDHNSSGNNVDNTENKNDSTVAQESFPNTGIRNILIVVLIILSIAVIAFIRYKNLNSYVK